MGWRLDDPSYERAAKAALPNLRAALAGTLEVPPQADTAEASLALALFYEDRRQPGLVQELEDILPVADYVLEEIPTWAEVAGAFLRLRRRGWLAEKGDQWGLTREGRQAIDRIVTSTMVQEAHEQLKAWLERHP